MASAPQAGGLTAALQPAGVVAMQRSAGNRATTRFLQPLTRAGRQVLAGRWIVMDERGSACFWEKENEGDDRPEVPTSLLHAELRDPAPPRTSYEVLDGKRKVPRGGGAPLVYTLDWWATLFPRSLGGGGKDNFNPFGRMGSATITSFLPGRQLSSKTATAILAALAESDPSYAPILRQGDRRGRSGAPEQVTVSVDGKEQVLTWVQETDFGATYASSAPSNERATARSSKAGDASNLPFVSAQPSFKEVWNHTINQTELKAWAGRKRSSTQAQVMGVSAAAAAINAGFAADADQGWEWLHLIAHSMGGATGHGPQVPDNLVAGTTECNSQMIVVEEWLKEVVLNTKGHAVLSVQAALYDAVRHIGTGIVYDFELYNRDGKPTDVYHFQFDPLSRAKPLASYNREQRYAARETHGVDAPAATQHMPRSQPTAHKPYTPVSEDATNKLVDWVTEPLQQGSVEGYALRLAQLISKRVQIPSAAFTEAAEYLTVDSLARTLQGLKTLPLPQEAFAFLLYSYVGEHPGDRRVVRDKMLPWAFGSPPPAMLVSACTEKDPEVVVQRMDDDIIVDAPEQQVNATSSPEPDDEMEQ